MKRLLVVAGALLALMSASQAGEAVQKETVLYSAARKILLSRGFHPYSLPGAEACTDDGHRCYPELVTCTSKRRWSCDYTWKLNGVVYQVETSAETPVVDSFYCILNCASVKAASLTLEDEE